MADETTLTAPEATTAPAAPLRGMAQFMADVTPKDEPEVKTPAVPTTPKTEPKTEPKAEPAKKPDAKVEPAKPDAKADPKTTTAPQPKAEGPAELRKRLDEVSKSEKALRTEHESLRKQNEELSKRRHVTPEMEKEMEDNRKEMAALKQQLAESAYERSDAYKRDFRDPIDQAAQAAIATVEQFQIVTDEETGASRPATKADLARLARLSPNERGAEAVKMFGVNAGTVLADIREVERLELKAQAAVKNHRDQFEARNKEEERQLSEQQKQFENHRVSAREQLTTQYPELFGDSEDPEIQQAWTTGRDFVKNAAAKAQDLPAEERAMLNEVLTARAEWFTRGHATIKKLKAEVEEVKAELARYRASDPGSASETPGDKPKQEEARGEKAIGKLFEGLD